MAALQIRVGQLMLKPVLQPKSYQEVKAQTSHCLWSLREKGLGVLIIYRKPRGMMGKAPELHLVYLMLIMVGLSIQEL